MYVVTQKRPISTIMLLILIIIVHRPLNILLLSLLLFVCIVIDKSYKILEEKRSFINGSTTGEYE